MPGRGGRVLDPDWGGPIGDKRAKGGRVVLAQRHETARVR